MNRDELTKRHWSYYLMLEKRFMESIEYVDLHEDNYNAFSDGYALLLQVIGAELDSMFKVFCNFNTSDTRKISDYANFIFDKKPEILDYVLEIRQYDLQIQPFKEWDKEKAKQSLRWWESFDNIKHNRYVCRKEANQENVLNMLGALYLLEKIHLKNITENTNEFDIFSEESKLFSIKEMSFRTFSLCSTYLGDVGEIEVQV